MHYFHHVKIIHIRSFSGPYLVRMRGNADQKNSKLFSRSILTFWRFFIYLYQFDISKEIRVI